jgi:hypothetical protein
MADLPKMGGFPVWLTTSVHGLEYDVGMKINFYTYMDVTYVFLFWRKQKTD